MTAVKPVVFLACNVFNGLARGQEGVRNQFMDVGLHATPKRLTTTLQAEIDGIDEPSLIVLGYGLCGNGLHGIAAGKHTLVIPRADDCVAFFMGSRRRYMEEFQANPGTYYLTKGWLEVGTDPLSEYERYQEKYDPETAAWLMQEQYKHYKRLVFVSLSDEESAQYRERVAAVATYCREQFGMAYEEMRGSGEFIADISSVLADQERIPESFIVVPAGKTLTMELFRD